MDRSFKERLLTLVLNPNLDLCLVQRLSSLHDERYTLPPRVVDVHDGGSERRAVGSLRDSVVVEVARLISLGDVLTEEHVLLVDRGHESEDLDLEKGMKCREDELVKRRGWLDGQFEEARIENANLFVSDVLGREGNRSLHGEDGESLEEICMKGKAKHISSARFGRSTLAQ